MKKFIKITMCALAITSIIFAECFETDIRSGSLYTLVGSTICQEFKDTKGNVIRCQGTKLEYTLPLASYCKPVKGGFEVVPVIQTSG